MKINNQQRILFAYQVKPIHMTVHSGQYTLTLSLSHILPESHPYIAVRKQADVPW